MKSKSRPRSQDACVHTVTGTVNARKHQSAPKPKAGRARLARRMSAGLLRRLSFGRTGTGDLSDEEGPAAPRAPPWSSPLDDGPSAPPFPSPSCLDDVDGDRGDAGALAQEVGQNAQEYLEECFDTEGPVLARANFAAIPEMEAAELTILEHVGKGSFCDVCAVVCKVSDSAHAPNGPTFAMKRLRRQVCADPELFAMGAEDLVHETAVLAGLDHPHVIQLHGRVKGSVAAAFAAPGGYFVLLEHLRSTLPDRLAAWRRPDAPRGGRLAVAHPIADAAAYLHAQRVVFRDLKPDNVGFDHRGRVKLFDFGFAAGLPDGDPTNLEGLLYDRCGTPRYMAPEVGRHSRGYGAPADVYSFGVLLWEMCALAKPFADITKAEDFERIVFEEGRRLEISKEWPSAVKRLMRSCWATAPSKRPTMEEVKSSLSVAMSSSDF